MDYGGMICLCYMLHKISLGDTAKNDSLLNYINLFIIMILFVLFVWAKNIELLWNTGYWQKLIKSMKQGSLFYFVMLRAPESPRVLYVSHALDIFRKLSMS
jgi:hypothetical protein